MRRTKKVKLISTCTRLLVVGLLSIMLLMGNHSASRSSPAIVTSSTPKVQKYVFMNIESPQPPEVRTKIRSQFFERLGNGGFSDLDVVIEERAWLDSQRCKPGDDCDLITIDLESRKLKIRCTTRKEFFYYPDKPYQCPYSPDRCILSLPYHLPAELRLHDGIHQAKK